MDVVHALKHLPLKKFALTSNGFHLFSLIPELKRAGINSINISIDSLKSERFKEITKRDAFKEVIASAEASVASGIKTKVNAVAMRGINDDELFDYIDFSRRTGIEVRFLELMKIGPEQEDFSSMFISMNEMVARLSEHYQLKKAVTPIDNTAREFEIEGGGRVGFIASESQSFCDTCSRLRLTATGTLRSCLFRNDGIDVRDLNDDAFEKVLIKVAAMKPRGRIDKIEQPMYAIGG